MGYNHHKSHFQFDQEYLISNIFHQQHLVPLVAHRMPKDSQKLRYLSLFSLQLSY